MERIKILLVDDQQPIRDGIQSMLENTGDLEVIGSVSSGEDAINEVRQNRPDVILMDIKMGGMTGIEAARWIMDFDPTIKVVLLTREISKVYVSAAINSGVDGYLPKDVDEETLMKALRIAHGGGLFFNDAIVKLVFEEFHSGKTKNLYRKLIDDLTKTESDVFGLVATGRTNNEVAEFLLITVKAVETHKAHIIEKLGLKNVTELVKYAIKNKIISIDSPPSPGDLK